MLEIKRINDLQNDEVAYFVRLNENELKHYFEPEPEGIFIAETPTVVERALDGGYEPLSFLIEEKYLDTQARGIIEKCRGYAESRNVAVPVYTAEMSVLSKLTGFNMTRGFLGAFKRKKAKEPEEIIRNAHRIVILEHVENPTNIGAIMRSAAALSIDALLLTRGCADPLQRRAIRTGVGTAFQIPWAYIEDSKEWQWDKNGVKKLHEFGFKTAALALRNDTVSIGDGRLKEEERLAILMGNEGRGLSEQTIAASDYTVKIPMGHGVDSLNVAAASAIAFWELGKTCFYRGK